MPASLASVGWPVLDRFRLGDSIAISPHGLGIAVGFMVGAWLFTKLAVRRGVPVEAANSIVFWSLIGAVVGARVAYVIAHVSEFESPLEWVEIWKGGISLLGGIAGATIANAVNIKRQAYRFRFFQIADAIVPGLALGISVGRIGDLIIGDHLGKPTSWLLAWTYEGGTLAPPFSCTPEIAGTGGRCAAALQGTFTQTIDRTQAILRDGGEVVARGIGVHQTALYDMLLAGLLFGFLWWFIGSPRREGVATLVFALSYGCIRLLEDSLRIDKRFGPFTGSQWTALTVAIVAAGFLIVWAVSKPPGATTPGRRDPIPGDVEPVSTS
ncbi:MAG: prolipoprotein diacylglyceryl transferase family protein [Actinomycetota bacterium]